MKWFDKIKEAAAAKQHAAGYSYAASELLKSADKRMTLSKLEGQAFNPFDSGAFEHGVHEALFDYASLTQAKAITAEMVRAGRDAWNSDEAFMMNLKHAYQAMRNVELGDLK